MYVIELRHDAVFRYAGSYDISPSICRRSVAWIVPSTMGSVYSSPVRLSVTVRSSDCTRSTVLGGVDSLHGVDPLPLFGLVRGDIGCAALPDHGHADLARVF